MYNKRIKVQDTRQDGLADALVGRAQKEREQVTGSAEKEIHGQEGAGGSRA